MKTVTEKKGPWREVRSEGTGGVRSERERIGRQYVRAVEEWRGPRSFSELSLTVPVALFLRRSITCFVDEF